ncbi:Crp/Fnr family transcriptional regulator [Candidatus Daviesbacteria bacterium]|nr:Crp/Fnr family transcriptional regulator [Candidatus Daviesbacteria bacterium]
MQHDLNSLKSRLENIWKPADFERIFTSSKRPPHLIRQKTILFSDGDPLDKLYLIKEGFVKLYRLSEEGKETTIYPYGPGDVLGLRALISKDRCTKHNAECLTDIKVMILSHQEFFNLTLRQPKYLIDLMHLCLNRLLYTETRLEAFITTDTTSRVAIFLDYCMKRFGKETDSKVTLPIILTHQLIAEFIGSVRETVTLALHKLEKEKILEIEKGRITILDAKALKEYCL